MNAMSETESDNKDARASRIPSFATIEEEAEFWDTHDVMDFEDELEPIEDLVIGPIRTSRGLIVRFSGDVLERMERIAALKGTSPSSMARMWIEQGIEQEIRRDPRLAG
jgi:hypothetical protein